MTHIPDLLQVLEHWINVLVSRIRLEDSAPSWNGPVFVQLCSNPRLVRVLYLNVWQFVIDGSKDSSNVQFFPVPVPESVHLFLLKSR